jgi:hypothetical protein
MKIQLYSMSKIQLYSMSHGRVLMHSTIKQGVGERTLLILHTFKSETRRTIKLLKLVVRVGGEGEALILFNFLSMHKCPSHPLPLLLLACAA